MPKSTEMYDRPIDDIREDCYICGSSSTLLNLYHPTKVREGERGIVITACRSCYGSYKSLNNPYGDFVKIISKLKSRKRYGSVALHRDVRWHQDLDMYFDPATSELSAVKDSVTGEDRIVEDVLNFTRVRGWLFKQPKDTVEKWCKDNLTDQRFINKVVSSFSS